MTDEHLYIGNPKPIPLKRTSAAFRAHAQALLDRGLRPLNEEPGRLKGNRDDPSSITSDEIWNAMRVILAERSP